ncbi:MAG: ABC transporter permease [Planctomycetota bacterium]|jgi:putative aldouronate transport system permease protein
MAELKGKGLLHQYWKSRDLLLMFLPCLFFLILFKYIPMGGLMIAFKDYNMQLGVLESAWVGLDNFRELFSGDEFIDAIRNTLTISLLKLFFGFSSPIVLAILLNELRLRWYAKGVQTLTLLPYFFSWVILAGIFRLMLSQSGSVNELLAIFGIDAIEWLTNDFWFVFMLIVTEVWKGVGYGCIVYLAAISGISPDLYEAASIDGANRWQQIRHITLPALVPTIITLLILSLGRVLTAGFDQIYNLYNPTVYDVSDIIDTFVLRRLMALDFELGTAASMFTSLISMALILVVNKLARRMSDGEQGVF